MAKDWVDKPTSAKPIRVKDVVFHCYHTGIQRYEWRALDGRLRVGSNYNLATYYAVVDGVRLRPRFRFRNTAMIAAVAAASKRERQNESA